MELAATELVPGQKVLTYFQYKGQAGKALVAAWRPRMEPARTTFKGGQSRLVKTQLALEQRPRLD